MAGAVRSARAGSRATTLAAGERVISETVLRRALGGARLLDRRRLADEPNAKAGVSHFIEHLLFKGSSRYTAQEIAEIFDALGGELNAATSRETTVVYARVPDERLETALDVMADMVFEPAFAEVDPEREVVLEEIAMVEDNPQDSCTTSSAEAIFGGHPLGRPVIGRADVIAGVAAARSIGVPPRAYVGSNVVLAAAGNVEHAHLVEPPPARADGALPPRLAARKPLARVAAPGIRFQAKPTEQYHVCLGAPGVSRTDERRFAASLLDAIVGGSASSRLFQEIREKRGMAYAVYSFGSQYADAGQIGVYLGTREENLAACLEIAAEQLADVGAGNVRPGELERAKENLKGRLLLSLESTSNRMSRLGKGVVTGSQLLTTDEVIERIEAVDAAEVSALAAQLLAPERLSAAGIGPNEERFRAAVERVNPSLLARAAMRVALYGIRGRVGSVLAPALRERGHDVTDAEPGVRRGGRLHAADSVPCERARVPGRGRSGRRRHERLGPEAVDEAARTAGLPVLYAPNFALGAVLMMRFAAEAARHFHGGRDRRAPPRGEARRTVGHREATAAAMGTDPPIHSVRPPASSRTRRCCSAAGGDADDPPRHDLARGVRPGVLLALERLRSLPPGVTVGLDALL